MGTQYITFVKLFFSIPPRGKYSYFTGKKTEDVSRWRGVERWGIGGQWKEAWGNFTCRKGHQTHPSDDNIFTTRSTSCNCWPFQGQRPCYFLRQKLTAGNTSEGPYASGSILERVYDVSTFFFLFLSISLKVYFVKSPGKKTMRSDFTFVRVMEMW